MSKWLDDLEAKARAAHDSGEFGSEADTQFMEALDPATLLRLCELLKDFGQLARDLRSLEYRSVLEDRAESLLARMETADDPG